MKLTLERLATNGRYDVGVGAVGHANEGWRWPEVGSLEDDHQEHRK